MEDKSNWYFCIFIVHMYFWISYVTFLAIVKCQVWPLSIYIAFFEYSSHNILWFPVFKTAFLLCTQHFYVIFSKWNKRKMLFVSDMNKYWTEIFVYIPIRQQLFTWCKISRNPICQLIIQVKKYISNNWNQKPQHPYQNFSCNIQKFSYVFLIHDMNSYFIGVF